ncbi:MAG: hypothetical protein K2M97_08245 [Muribaculaceae bacterium]|nr:hypothetical protein [Muribaculaceae bacterium]
MGKISTRSFHGEAGSVTAHHSLIIAEGITAAEQAADLRQMIAEQVPGTPVYIRIMVSDAANQADLLAEIAANATCPVKIIEQCPLYGGVKFAALVFSEDGRYGTSPHRYVAGMTDKGTSYDTTKKILSYFASDGNMERECVRTWFFVNDIDNNYAGMVKARNEVFALHGLTSGTHFIASTGIAGRNADHNAPITFDAYSISGITPERITYLKALTHLNPTMEYGVAFERATAVDFADRRMILISGTASINNRGEILHTGNIEAQCRRMVENVAALLNEGGASLSDLMHVIVYLRDPADAITANRVLRQILPPETGYVMVHAPVCRPGWLVEMEGVTFTNASNPGYPTF